jgi:hypothetical protein
VAGVVLQQCTVQGARTGTRRRVLGLANPATLYSAGFDYSGDSLQNQLTRVVVVPKQPRQRKGRLPTFLALVHDTNCAFRQYALEPGPRRVLPERGTIRCTD